MKQDFFKTAKLNNEYVSVLKYYRNSDSYDIKTINGKVINVKASNLTNFRL